MYEYPNIESIIVEKINIKEPLEPCSTERVPSYTLTCKVLESEVNNTISTKSDEDTVSKSYPRYLYPRIIMTRNSSNHSIQGSTSRFGASPALLQMGSPSELDGSIKMLQK
ncbi:hypothetical protein MAM1_0012c01256 [Mucor ambiguus]|uniref:Uncharacterized protein n=1 Tax=Mucor ambiguus TaxID=91626 RepID=A0A0C9M0V7_9FUNG|nr:hypothetical protein MAM1_0012c01256 [Mucor ambiguus]